MSEIRFRAWDKNSETLVNIKTIDLEADGSVGCVVDFDDINLDVSECVLMQYTGLKDKNDVEIYEGDIVCDRYANNYTPIFRNGTYMAYNVDCLYLTKQEPSTQFNVVWKDGCEVIGNIHDNPELLKTKKI